MEANGDPNDPGDVTVNPCQVAGDTTCAPGRRFGPYLFTNVHRPYDASQQVQRMFAELAVKLGSRLDTQLAANYEFYNVAGSRVDSFDPKVGWRFQAAENQDFSLSFRGSAQTTFRTPSLGDLNTSPLTTLEWISETGAYQAVDRFGRTDLLAERAFTYNAGVVLFLAGGVEATVDYWTYDFENVIGSMPYDSISSLYASGDAATRNAVAVHHLSRRPGFGARGSGPLRRAEPPAHPGRPGELAGTHHLGDRHRPGGPHRRGTGAALAQLGLHLHPPLRHQGAAAGRLRSGPEGGRGGCRLPELRAPDRGAAAPLEEPLVGRLRLGSIPAGELRELHLVLRGSGDDEIVPLIEPFLTWDVSLLWRGPGGVNLTVYGMNLTGRVPPWVNIEQAFDGFTHDAKGRRIKAALSWRFGA